MLSNIHLISIFATIGLVTALGIYSMKKVNSAKDFALGGNNAGVSLLIGTLVGTIAGGASTIGTAQLSYTYGFSAWWFTLGAGVALIVLGAFFAKPLRDSESTTGPELLSKVYGESARPWASIFSSMGIFLNIVGQILSAVALITAMFDISSIWAAIISVFLVVFYVIFGGVWGTGMVGILKTVLIYVSMVIIGIMAFNMAEGFSGIKSSLPSYPYLSLFGRGVRTDLAAGFSLLVGVLSTQTYLQAIFSGRSYKVSRNAGIISGLIIPPIGLAGVFVGLYMRMNFPTITPKEALPLFILSYLPDWLGGIVLATLFIAVIGTGAGLVLGISTMLTQDIYKNIFNKNASDKQILDFSRYAIVGVTILTIFFVTGNMNSLILKWSFLSMGLRGATMCFPLIGALFFRKYVTKRAGLWAIGLAPVVTIVWAIFMSEYLDPLYVGLLVSILTLVIDSIFFK